MTVGGLIACVSKSGPKETMDRLAAELPESRPKSADSLSDGAASGWRVGERI